MEKKKIDIRTDSVVTEKTPIVSSDRKGGNKMTVISSVSLRNFYTMQKRNRRVLGLHRRVH